LLRLLLALHAVSAIHPTELQNADGSLAFRDEIKNLLQLVR
jgi:hypothetical protein